MRVTPRIGPPRFGLEPLPPRRRLRIRAAIERERTSRGPGAARAAERSRRRVLPGRASVGNGRALSAAFRRDAGQRHHRAGARGIAASTCARRCSRAFARNEPSLSGPIAVRFNGAARRVYLQARPLSADPSASAIGDRVLLRGRCARRRGGGRAHGRGARRPASKSSSSSRSCSSPSRSCAASREEYEGANEELAPPTRSCSRSTRNTARPPRSWRPARRSCSRSTRSCRRSTAN